MKHLILASKSPRRKEILSKFGYEFEIKVSGFEEKTTNLPPEELVMSFSKGKAESVYLELSENDKKNSVVLGCDTIVVFGDKIVGKPKDENDAFYTLKLLERNTHYVYSGFTLISNNKTITKLAKSTVEFNHLTDDQIKEYIEKFRPLDKAGSYGIQDDFPIVKGFNGSYYNIMGLPIEDIKPFLDEMIK